MKDIEELNDEPDTVNKANLHANKIEENSVLFERLEAKAAQLKFRTQSLKEPELVEKQCQEILQKIAEINALCQIYARKCAIKAANAALKNDLQQSQEKEKKVLDKKIDELPNLLKKRQNDISLTATVNDASSLSSYSCSTDGPSSTNISQSVTNCLSDFRNAQSYLNFEHFPIISLDDWRSRLKVLAFH